MGMAVSFGTAGGTFIYIGQPQLHEESVRNTK
jgi:hypothetical protein